MCGSGFTQMFRLFMTTMGSIHVGLYMLTLPVRIVQLTHPVTGSEY